MDLCNPTGDKISLMFDGVPYIFKPQSVMTLGDEAGAHCLALGAKFGIVRVQWGDDAEKVRYTGLRARYLYYAKVIEEHELVNARQTELKFPPITDSDSVRQAKIAAPIYKKALGKMEDRLGNEAAAAYAADLEAVLAEAAPKLPHIKDATLDQLRAEATRLGIQWQPGWNYVELREAIESARLTAALPPAPVGPDLAPGPGLSAPVVGPNPDIAPDALTSGDFTRI